MNLLEGLNDNQKRAVMSDSQYIRIIAGAGSGKTRVLTTRIAHLIQDLNVDSKDILAITFTNKAANEMKERIMKILDDPSSAVTVCTIHSLCVRILKQDITALNYPRNFTIMDAEDQKSILKEAYKELNIDKQKLSFNNVLSYISNCKFEDIDPDQAMSMAYFSEDEKKKASVYDYYVKRLRELYALDFDDLLLFVVRLFDQNVAVREKWAYRFSFIHVDEFQDIDKVQYKIIKYLTGKDNFLYVVGDPDQTIYSWRGADVNIIMNYEHDFKSETIILNQNYRSTSPILNGANSLIKNNKNRYKKDLFTTSDGGEKIIHKSFGSEEEEANWVSYNIHRLQEKGIDYRNIGILYRANYLSRSIEKSLIENRIPYIIFGGIRFYERAEIKDILSYLRMILVNDDLAFKRIINVPKRGIGNKTVETIFDFARENNISMYDAIKENKLFNGRTQKLLDDFVAMVEKWKKAMTSSTIEELVEMCLKDTNYITILEDNNETDRIENIKELQNDIKGYQESYPESTLEDYLQLISLYGDKSQYESGEYVQLMTIHAAKGLEFDYVFVIGLSDGVFPSERSMAEGVKGVEEERRLAYVAMTRAKKQLFLSDVSGYSFVLNKSRITSRFINEIDENYIEHQNQLRKKFVKEETMSEIFSTTQTSIPSASSGKKYKKGDKVKHNMYGEGVVIKIDGDILQIAFSYPYGLKNISKKFKGLSKI